MTIIKVNINDVYARIGIINEELRTIGKLKIVSLPESPHYQFLEGNEEPYIKYMELAEQPEHSVRLFRKLISEFDVEKSKYVKCREDKGKYVIRDGFHRSCIMLFKGYKEIEIIIY